MSPKVQLVQVYRVVKVVQPEPGLKVTRVGTQGPGGPPGERGARGERGEPGVGLPGGGAAGQILRKSSNDDFAYAWGDPSGGYTHAQNTASAVWVINHNLGYRPAISLYSAGGAEFDAEILHLNENQAQVYLESAFAGYARCI